MGNTDYIVTVEGPELTFSKKVGKDSADQIVLFATIGHDFQDKRLINNNINDLAAAEVVIEPQESRLSLREFWDDYSPKFNPDKIAVIALFLEKHRGKELFKSSDVITLWKEAREPLPANLSRDFNDAKAMGLIAPDNNERGAYYLTNRGREFAKTKFSQEYRKSINPITRKSRSTKPKESIVS